MWKYFVIGALLLQGANAQPAKQKPQRQQQSAAPSVSPTSLNERQVEAGDKPNGASNGQQGKQDDETKAFQRTQIKQYWVLVFTSVVTVVLLIAYTIFAGLQWYWIRQQAKETGAQLAVIKKQSRTMLGTWRVIRQQTKVMQGQLEAINKQEGHLSDQAEAAKTQAETMQGQLEAIKIQNATLHESIAIGEQSAIYANRAYITASIEGIAEGFQFHLIIENKGNTPANDVHVSFSCRMSDKPPYDIKDGNMVVYDFGFMHDQRLGLIAPERNYPVVTPKRDPNFLEGEWDKWMAGHIRYYCWGRIYYEDIFNKKRHTDFAFFQARGYPNGYPCEYGNSAI